MRNNGVRCHTVAEVLKRGWEAVMKRHEPVWVFLPVNTNHPPRPPFANVERPMVDLSGLRRVELRFWGKGKLNELAGSGTASAAA
jgi:hypothetical protein